MYWVNSLSHLETLSIVLKLAATNSHKSPFTIASQPTLGLSAHRPCIKPQAINKLCQRLLKDNSALHNRIKINQITVNAPHIIASPTSTKIPAYQ